MTTKVISADGLLVPIAIANIFEECVANQEDTSNFVSVDGIKYYDTVCFQADRLEFFKPRIVFALQQLPEQFRTKRNGGNGGWAYLRGRVDRHGREWTLLDDRVEELFLLAIACDFAEYLLPKKRWDEFEGAIPYIVVLV